MRLKFPEFSIKEMGPKWDDDPLWRAHIFQVPQPPISFRFFGSPTYSHQKHIPFRNHEFTILMGGQTRTTWDLFHSAKPPGVQRGVTWLPRRRIWADHLSPLLETWLVSKQEWFFIPNLGEIWGIYGNLILFSFLEPLKQIQEKWSPNIS